MSDTTSEKFDLSFQRANLQKIYRKALASVDSFSAVSKSMIVHEGNLQVQDMHGKETAIYDLEKLNNIYLTGCGKASASMAAAVAEILPKGSISEGTISVKYGHAHKGVPGNVTIHQAGHPEPDNQSAIACKEAMELLQKASSGDLVIALLSGGGSSLWAMPSGSISMNDLIAANRLLVNCGASIKEINVVRKHLSRVKGGAAAIEAYPSHVLVLAVSDVIGDEAGTICSGPFSPNSSCFHDAQKILGRYDLTAEMPETVIAHLENGRREEKPDKGTDLDRMKVDFAVVASNRMAVDEAKRVSESMGYLTKTINKPVTGESSREAAIFAEMLRKHAQENRDIPVCLISGGESVVNLGINHGKGGRNQEFSVAAAVEIAEYASTLLSERTECVILSCGTDGTDGPTDAAGGIVDSRTIERAEGLGISSETVLQNHNSYELLQATGDLIVTGPTGTNVMDIQIGSAFCDGRKQHISRNKLYHALRTKVSRS